MPYNLAVIKIAKEPFISIETYIKEKKNQPCIMSKSDVKDRRKKTSRK